MPLVADGQQLVGGIGDADHVLALAYVPGHQLLAQDVLAFAERFHRHRGVQVEGQGDDDHFDLGVIEQLMVVLVQTNALLRLAAVMVLEADSLSLVSAAANSGVS